MKDLWEKLWNLAVDTVPGPGCKRNEVCTIEPDPDDLGSVTLVWSDGTRAEVYWHDGDWQFAQSRAVASRDLNDYCEECAVIVGKSRSSCPY